MVTRKYIIAEDTKFIVANVINVISSGSEEVDYDLAVDMNQLSSIINSTKLLEYHIMILDLNFPDGNSLQIIPQIKEKSPNLFIIVISAQPEIRIALSALDSGADSYVCKGVSFNADLMVSINSAIRQIVLKEENILLKETIFQEGNFPFVMFKFSDFGVEPIFKDFIAFPEKMDRDVNAFLINLGISLAMVLRADEDYIEGVFALPAGGSKTFTVLLLALKIPDEAAVDDRMKIGFFQFCLFVPQIYGSLMPVPDKLNYLIEEIKNEIQDARELTDEFNKYIKMKVLESLKNLV